MPDSPNQINVVVTQPITKGCIVLVAYELLEEDEIAYMMNELRRAAGHDRFLVLRAKPGETLSVHGPDDLVSAVRQLAKEAHDAPAEEDDNPAAKSELGAAS